jgi:hypothetical protein
MLKMLSEKGCSNRPDSRVEQSLILRSFAPEGMALKGL